MNSEDISMENGFLLRKTDVSTTKENDEVIMRSNKRSKILNASAQGRNEHKNRITKPRKRKYTEFTANSENEQNIDESKALEHKKRRLLLHKTLIQC